MQIKNRLFFGLALALLAFAGYLTLGRLQFVSQARHTVGTVRNVTARNGRSGGKHSHDVTKFQAVIDFSAGEQQSSLWVSAGERSGHNQPVDWARHHAGNQVPVTYNPKNLNQAYRDSFWDVWAAPLIAFFIDGILFLFAFLGVSQRRRFGATTPPTPPAPTGPPTPLDSSGPTIKVI